MIYCLMSQFVPFRDYMDRTGNHVLSMARLAKDVLAEIPDQLISYMKSRAIKPNPVPPPYSSCKQPETESVWSPPPTRHRLGRGRFHINANDPYEQKVGMISRHFYPSETIKLYEEPEQRDSCRGTGW